MKSLIEAIRTAHRYPSLFFTQIILLLYVVLTLGIPGYWIVATIIKSSENGQQGLSNLLEVINFSNSAVLSQITIYSIIILASGLALFLLSPIYDAGTIGIFNSATEGEKPKIKAFFHFARMNYGKLLGLLVLTGVTKFIIDLIIGEIGIVTGVQDSQMFKFISQIVDLIYSILVSFAPYALVLDGEGVLKSIRTGIRLGFKGFFQYLLPMILIIVIGIVAIALCIFLFFELSQVLSIVIFTIILIYGGTIFSIWMVTMYKELK